LAARNSASRIPPFTIDSRAFFETNWPADFPQANGVTLDSSAFNKAYSVAVCYANGRAIDLGAEYPAPIDIFSIHEEPVRSIDASTDYTITVYGRTVCCSFELAYEPCAYALADNDCSDVATDHSQTVIQTDTRAVDR